MSAGESSLQMLQTAVGSSHSSPALVELSLTAAILAVFDSEPRVLVVAATGDRSAPNDALPSGPFYPRDHRTLEIGVRSSVAAQTGVDLGYVEQLYTFGDRGRHAARDDSSPPIVSIGYVALRPFCEVHSAQNVWRSWYHYFPWEDRREGVPPLIENEIIPRLKAWARAPLKPDAPVRPIERSERVRMCFGSDGGSWDEEKVLERYELLYEAGLTTEAARDGRVPFEAGSFALGRTMQFDHRRILATAISRIRGKIKYRPVIFELLPDEFTLLELQRTVEAILGPHLHKQNFRRLVEGGGLVEPTGVVKAATGGRPAKMYRFRRDVLLERPSPGVRIKAGRA